MEGKSKNNPICLLLIDVQKDFYTSNEAIGKSFPHFATNITNILTQSREMGIEIVHVRAVYDKDRSDWFSYWNILSPDRARSINETPEPFAEAIEGEKIIIKHSFDAFHNTELESYLKSRGKKILIICGLVTSCCVLFTTSGAFMRGFLTCVVEDCCGDRTIEKHDNTFNMFGYLFTRSSLSQLKETCDIMLERLERLST